MLADDGMYTEKITKTFTAVGADALAVKICHALGLNPDMVTELKLSFETATYSKVALHVQATVISLDNKVSDDLLNLDWKISDDDSE